MIRAKLQRNDKNVATKTTYSQAYSDSTPAAMYASLPNRRGHIGRCGTAANYPTSLTAYRLSNVARTAILSQRAASRHGINTHGHGVTATTMRSDVPSRGEFS